MWVQLARKYAQPKAVCATKIVRVYCTSASLSRMLAHVRAASVPHSVRRSLSRAGARACEFMRRFPSNEGPASSSSSDSSRTGDDASSRASRRLPLPLAGLTAHPAVSLPPLLSSSLNKRWIQLNRRSRSLSCSHSGPFQALLRDFSLIYFWQPTRTGGCGLNSVT